MAVTYNVDPKAFDVVDLGGRPRSVADVFGLKTGEQWTTLLVASCRMLKAIAVDDVKFMQRMTPAEVDATFAQYREELRWAVRACGTGAGGKGPWRLAPFVAAMAYAYPAAPEKIQEFVDTLKSETAAKTKTMAALKRAFEREGSIHNASTRVSLFHLSLRALFFHLKGEEREALFHSGKGKEAGEAYDREYRSFRAKRQRAGLPE